MILFDFALSESYKNVQFRISSNFAVLNFKLDIKFRVVKVSRLIS